MAATKTHQVETGFHYGCLDGWERSQRPASEGASSPASLTTKASRGCFNGYDQIRAVSAHLKQRQFDRCRAHVSKLRAAPAAPSARGAARA
jgi:hypothetical protein